MTFGGAGPFADVGTVDLDGVRCQIDMCLDAGVNLIDTADVYSGGLSEELIGEALAGRRDGVLLATKARMPMGEGPNDAGLSRHHLIEACEASLRRLRTDHIDLYQVHEWDGQTPLEETLDALDALVRAGKVRYIGCSNYAGSQLTKALVILVWSPLAGGLLSGKYRRDQPDPEVGRQLTDWQEPPVRDREALYDIVEVLVEIAEERGVSAAQVALAYTRDRPGVTSIVVGARTEEQLTDNLKAAELVLTDEERRRLDEVSAPPLLYPCWHQAKTAADRLSPAEDLLGRHRDQRPSPLALTLGVAELLQPLADHRTALAARVTLAAALLGADRLRHR
jgi:aryl-alcohol dehydrogenase-like predicted oxidoreductase